MINQTIKMREKYKLLFSSPSSPSNQKLAKGSPSNGLRLAHSSFI